MIAQRSGDGFRGDAALQPAEPAGSGRVDPDGADAADRDVPRAHAAVRARVGRPVPARGAAGARQQALGARIQRGQGDGLVDERHEDADQTVTARFWAEAPVQQARGSFRKFVLDRRLDVAEAARFMAMMSVTYADARDRLLRREVPLRVLAADHGHPRRRHGRQRRDRRRPAWSPLLPATPNHPEYPSAHSCITPGGGTGRREVPRDAARSTSPSPA